jgi:hypothetical protein
MSPSGLRGCPFSAGQYKPFWRPASLRNVLAKSPRRFAVVARSRVLPLGGDVGAADLDRGQLVAADAAGEDFFLPRLGVESPAGLGFHDRDGERP